jgi:hypothetical protein
MGCFVYNLVTTPVVSALKNYHIQGFLEAPADIFNHFLILEAKRSLCGRLKRSKIYNGYVTAIPQRTKFSVREWRL